MSDLKDILFYNERFVEEKRYKAYETSKYPDKKIVVVTCMDTRLTYLLPAALGFKNGDVKIIKTAGGVITAPFGSAMRSIMVAVYELGVKDIMVVGHHDCGMLGMETVDFKAKMKQRGISQSTIDMVEKCGVNIDHWLKGFKCIEEAISDTVWLIQGHPLMPKDVKVHGFVIDPGTGKLVSHEK